MKHENHIFIGLIIGLSLLSCTDNLLDQIPRSEMASSEFWKSEGDATQALYGAYNTARKVFGTDYYLEGHGEYTRVRQAVATTNYISTNTADPYNVSGYGSHFDNMFEMCYGLVNDANYVIENTNKMIQSDDFSNVSGLEAVVAEAKFLRAIAYFRLISCWGDVPYFGKIIYSNDEVSNIARTPMIQIKDSILADLAYAYKKLPDPDKLVGYGRASKAAALAYRGKVQLYWASWNKYGWEELSMLGTFSPDQDVAKRAFAAAAADFKCVINDFGLELFRDGEPGDWGVMGDCAVLPNYFYLFQPSANNSKEYIFAITHGGPLSGQSEELMRWIAKRSVGNSQCVIQPRFEIIDRYQSTITGEFCDPVIGNPNRGLINGALNPQSYENRDFRMKATMLWEGEKMQTMSSSLADTGYGIYRFEQFTGVVDGFNVLNSNGDKTGLLFRKFIRNYVGQRRDEGDQSIPLMRLADVYLMYAEAINEANNGPDNLAIELVNKIRHRGNLPPLSVVKTSTKDEFFKAVEQERIVELIGEGHRGFDLRRWRKLEEVWGPPQGSGVQTKNTKGNNVTKYYDNAPVLNYQKNYIFKIPESERIKNPNLTQNIPWL